MQSGTNSRHKALADLTWKSVYLHEYVVALEGSMFSVIVPLYNEQKNIINLLNEIKINLSNYEKYEIVLIDDGSDDDTLNTIKLVENIKIKILENKKNLGQSFSIHTGIKHSSFNIIITMCSR